MEGLKLKKVQFIILLLINALLISLIGCGKKESNDISDKSVEEAFELKSGSYIYGDISTLDKCEMININTDDNSITYSSSPFSSYITIGKYSNDDINEYTFIDETGKKQSFSVEANAINYNSKRFNYNNENESTTSNTTDTSQSESNTDIEYNQFNKCTMEIVKGTVTSTGLKVRFTSTNENETTYGSYYRVEKYENNKWHEVQQKKLEGELAWTAEAYPIPTNGSRDCKIDWNWLYGELTNGQYRIIKNIIDFRGLGDHDEYYLSDEFKIE